MIPKRACLPPAFHKTLPRLSRRRHSLFLKLALIVALTGFAIDLVVVGFWRFSMRDRVHGQAEKHMRHYVELLLQEMDATTDTTLFAARARELNIEMQVHRADLRWESPNLNTLWQELRHSPSEPANALGLELRWKHGQLAALRIQGNDTVIVIASLRPFMPATKSIAAFCVALSAVLLATWVGMRLLLKPIHKLEQGVQALEQGQLDYRLPESGRDELSRLARAFNAMASSVEQRLQARDQLLRDVSHELRSPLTRLRLATEMLAPGQGQTDLLEDIGILETMVQEILESERLGSQAGGLRLAPTDINGLIQYEAKACEDRKPACILALPVTPVILMLDVERMRIVFRNLLDNAQKYSPPHAPAIQVALQQIENQWVFTIRDQGSGIGAEELPHIFEPFYRVDRTRTSKTGSQSGIDGGGFGLGLALVKRICDAHGIFIRVNSIPGQGTTFHLEFPRTA